MKLIIHQETDCDETEIVIRCSYISPDLQKIIDEIQLCTFSINAYKDGSIKRLNRESICYIESVDEKTFIYCENDVYDCRMKLYELEEKLVKSTFVRISKSCILNIDFIESVRPLLNGKYEALLLNGERLIINRHYVPDFKKKFGL